MAKVFFISDLHFGHESMAVKRGFKDAQEHDKYIIEKWNEVVSKRDVVYILGDITMEKKRDYYKLDMLNGIKHVVLGNHDRRQDVPELLKYVQSVAGTIKYKGYILTHIPIHESEIDRFRSNVHGHIHENEINHPKYINVSCEAADYTPRTLEELRNEENYNPYCKVCGACGEDGCCPAEQCKFVKEGKYCHWYIEDLKFDRLNLRKLEEIVDEEVSNKAFQEAWKEFKEEE